MIEPRVHWFSVVETVVDMISSPFLTKRVACMQFSTKPYTISRSPLNRDPIWRGGSTKMYA
jgi:hypothetical protein